MTKPTAQIRTPSSKNDFIQGKDIPTSGRPDVQTSKAAAPRQQTTVYFETELRKELKVFCAVHDREMSATVNEAVRTFLEEKG